MGDVAVYLLPQGRYGDEGHRGTDGCSTAAQITKLDGSYKASILCKSVFVSFLVLSVFVFVVVTHTGIIRLRTIPTFTPIHDAHS